jgi:hypothetical protein
MIAGKLTANAQTTIPRAVRAALKLGSATRILDAIVQPRARGGASQSNTSPLRRALRLRAFNPGETIGEG